MLTGMAEDDWGIVLEVFSAARSGRGQAGRDDRKFLEALHFSRFTTLRGEGGEDPMRVESGRV